MNSPSEATVRDAATGETVCTAPCDTKVAEAGTYQIVAGRPSTTFALNGADGHADVKVKPASNAKFWLGVGATGVGTGLAAAGAAVLIYAVNHKTPVPGSDGVNTDDTYTDRMSLGAGLAIAGAVAIVLGVSTIISNARSKVRGNIRTAGDLVVGTF